MKVAIRRVPFTPEKKNELTNLIENAGHEVLWLNADDELSP